MLELVDKDFKIDITTFMLSEIDENLIMNLEN